ncbi:MAG: GFA family protein [Myxococcales bacterium]|nr:GFA family protein [Myxococcales bacterium]
MTTPLHRYTGGCHCGAVRFEVTVRSHVALECNCSICKMKGFIHVIVPQADFALISGAGDLTTYTFNTHTAKHTFCRRCGVQAFYTPRSHPDGVSVNLRCLDAGHAPFTIEPFDGQAWEANVDAIR